MFAYIIHTFFGCLQEGTWYTDFWLRVEVSGYQPERLFIAEDPPKRCTNRHMHSHPFLFTLVTQTSPFKHDMIHAQQPTIYSGETGLTLKGKQYIFGGFNFQSGSFKVTVLQVLHLIMNEFTRIIIKKKKTAVKCIFYFTVNSYRILESFKLKRCTWMLQKLQPSAEETM